MSQPERAILVSETDAKNQIHSVLLQIRRHGRPAAMKRLRASDPEPRPRGRDGSEGTVR